MTTEELTITFLLINKNNIINQMIIIELRQLSPTCFGFPVYRLLMANLSDELENKNHACFSLDSKVNDFDDACDGGI